MDAFTWIIIVALGLCLLMHLFGHGHSHGGNAERQGHSSKQKYGGAEKGRSDEHDSHTADAGHRHGRGGCH
jgi:Protein of unknown function (DUF2933)